MQTNPFCPYEPEFPELPQEFWDNWASRFVFKSWIGKGAYGKVFSAYDGSVGCNVAIKWIPLSRENAKFVIREVATQKACQGHTNVLSMRYILLPDDTDEFKHVFIVLDLRPFNLRKLITERKLLFAHRRWIAYQLLHGLAHVHACGTIHRDLNPANVLCDENLSISICDFGMARCSGDQGAEDEAFSNYVTTRWYRAPELCGCFENVYDGKVDVWSVGCIMAEMILGKALFPAKDSVDLMRIIVGMWGKPDVTVISNIKNARALEFINGISDTLPGHGDFMFASVFKDQNELEIDLIKGLLEFDASKRLSASQSLMHPLFFGLDKLIPDAAVGKSSYQIHFEKDVDLSSSVKNELLRACVSSRMS